MNSALLLIVISLINYTPALFSSVTTEAGFKDVNKVPGAESCKCVPYYLCGDGGTVDSPGTTCDYLEVCCKESVTQSSIHPVEHPPRGCGTRNPEGVDFMINEEKNHTKFGEFPWMAAVLRKEASTYSKAINVYQCGGSLIHPQVVLTAAYCVSNSDSKFKIRVGEWDLQTKREMFPHQDRDVKTVIIHPKYNAATFLNNVAVLILETPIEISENVDVVCLPKQNMVIDETKCFSIGWSKNTLDKRGDYNAILQKLEMPVVPRNACQDRLRKTNLGEKYELLDGFICAGDESFICKGDEGSPLVCPIPGLKNRYYQAGIVVSRVNCGKDGIPGIYGNLATFSNWIDEQLVHNNFNESSYKY